MFTDAIPHPKFHHQQQQRKHLTRRQQLEQQQHQLTASLSLPASLEHHVLKSPKIQLVRSVLMCAQCMPDPVDSSRVCCVRNCGCVLGKLGMLVCGYAWVGVGYAWVCWVCFLCVIVGCAVCGCGWGGGVGCVMVGAHTCTSTVSRWHVLACSHHSCNGMYAPISL